MINNKYKTKKQVARKRKTQIKRQKKRTVTKKMQKNKIKKYKHKLRGGSSVDVDEEFILYFKSLLPTATKEDIDFVHRLLIEEEIQNMYSLVKKININDFTYLDLMRELPEAGITRVQFENMKSFFVNKDNEDTLTKLSITTFLDSLKNAISEHITVHNKTLPQEPHTTINELMVGGSSDNGSISSNIILMGLFIVTAIIYFKKQQHTTQTTKNFIYFYDNDIQNEIGCGSRIKFFLVKSTNKFRDNAFDRNFEELFFEEKQKNKLYDIMDTYKRLGWSNGYSYDQAVQNTELELIDHDGLYSGGLYYVDFFEHVEKAAKSKTCRHFIFDWDRTLQVLEGMLGFSDGSTTRQYMNDEDITGMATFLEYYIKSEKPSINQLGKLLAIYHAGGSKRLKKLKKMFKTINNSNIPVTIISSSIAIRNASDIYRYILKEWGCKNATLHFSPPGEKCKKIYELDL